MVLSDLLDQAMNMLTDHTGNLHLPLNDTTFTVPVVDPVSGPLGNITVILHSADLGGLNTFQDITLAVPGADEGMGKVATAFSLRTGLSMDSLSAFLNTTISIDLDQGALKGTSLVESFVFDLKLTDLRLGLDLFAPLNKVKLGDLFMDQLSAPCVMSAMEYMNITSLVVDMHIEELQLTPVNTLAGSLEEDIDELADNLLRLVVEGFPELVSGLIAGAMQGPVRSAINGKLYQELVGAEELCPAHVDQPTTDSWFVWSESTLLQTMDQYLSQYLCADGMNGVMATLTNNTGILYINIPATSPILAGWRIDISGLISFYEFAVMQPTSSSAFALTNLLGVGACDQEGASNSRGACSPLKIELEGIREGTHTMLGVKLTNFHMFIDTLAKINVGTLLNMRLSTLFTQPSNCMMSAVDSVALQTLDMSFSEVDLELKEDTVEIDVSAMVDMLLGMVNDPSTLVMVNDKLGASISASGAMCGVDPSSGGDVSPASGTTEWQLEMGFLIAGCVTALAGFIWIVYGRYKGYNAANNGRLDMDDSYNEQSGFSLVWINDQINDTLGYEGEQRVLYDALLAQDSIPVLVRLLFPVAVLGNIYLFVSSNLAVGASVQGLITLGEKSIETGSVFEFGLADTVSDMWEAKVYPLAILIAFFSGAWPYIKLGSMLVAWLAPSSALSVPMRDKVLLWLDILGKWSLLDTYVLVLMMVAFKMDLLLVEGVEVIIFVKPEWGFYSFLLATMMSLGLGHLLLGFHRVVCETPVPEEEEEDKAEAVMDHTFTALVHSGDDEAPAEDPASYASKHVSFTALGKAAVVSMLTLVIIATVFGTFTETFSFSFEGLTGYLMGETAVAPYSLVSIGNILPAASRSPGEFGIRWIQVSYFAFALVMPLMFLVALLCLWVTPLKLKTQKTAVVITEVLNAWNALDVFVVSIVAALMEIQQFAAFIVGENCDAINAALAEFYDEELEGDDKCFDVIATLKSDAWLLYVAAFMLIVAGLGVLGMCRTAVAERLDAALPVLGHGHRARSTSMSSCEMGDAAWKETQDGRLEPLLNSTEKDAAAETKPLVVSAGNDNDEALGQGDHTNEADTTKVSRGTRILASMVAGMAACGFMEIHENSMTLQAMKY